MEVANARGSATRQNYQANIAQQRVDADAAIGELHILRRRQQEMLASLPPE